jgi:hypothetical protein
MFDDLDDLLPKRQTSAALENPFEDVFSSGGTTSADPWSAMGSSGAGSFGAVDDWSTNAFADHESPFKNPANYGDPVPPETPKTEDITTPTYEEPPTPTAAVATRDDYVPPSSVVGSVTPSVPVVAAVDPLDAVASNIEEEEVHIPVIRRKLPLLSSEPTPSPLPEPTPAPPNEPSPAQVELEESQPEIETPPTEVPTSPSVATPSDEAPQTPTVTRATPPVAEITPPVGRRAPSPPSYKPTGPSTPSSHSSAFSEQAPSSSHQSSNIIVSPLETPSRSPIAPLSRNYSGLPLGTDAGGWGGGAFGGWGGSSSFPSTYGTEEVAATPSTETASEAEAPSEASVKPTVFTDEEDVSTRPSVCSVPKFHIYSPRITFPWPKPSGQGRCTALLSVIRRRSAIQSARTSSTRCTPRSVPFPFLLLPFHSKSIPL